jgi:methionyl-tRNA formyltransferase
VLLVMVEHILTDEVLEAPRLGAVNKHAAMLPANKGMFPYFWARLHGDPQGISFHKMTREIDAGPILAQERVDDRFTGSMLQFYHYVFERYPDLLLQALDALVSGRQVASARDVTPSRHPRPRGADYRRFAASGGRIVRWRDLRLAWRGPR